MDMDVAASVCLRVLGAQNEYLVEVLRPLGAVTEHRPHGGVAVDVGVLALQVVVLRLTEGQVLIDIHQATLHLTTDRKSVV